jgi:flagellar hook-length control protein FliK
VDTTVSGGPPSATGSGVLPVTSSLVPSAAPLVASVTPARGMPVPSAFPEMVHQQVFTAVSPLLRGADGTYGIRLDLHPKDLGAVQVNLHVRHGEISIQMNAVDPAARDALRSGLSDLRQQFEDQGLRAGSMEVGSGGADARQPETAWSRSRGVELPNNARSPSEQQATTKVAASNTALDLRM